MFMLVEKLIGDLDRRKQERLVDLRQGARPFMRPRLLQVDTIAGTIQCDFALFATTLRADATVDSGTEPLLVTFITNGTTHAVPLPKLLLHVSKDRSSR